MKFKELQYILNSLGYNLIRQSKHKIYSNGTITVAIPHSKQVNKLTCKRVFKLINYKEKYD